MCFVTGKASHFIVCWWKKMVGFPILDVRFLIKAHSEWLSKGTLREGHTARVVKCICFKLLPWGKSYLDNRPVLPIDPRRAIEKWHSAAYNCHIISLPHNDFCFPHIFFLMLLKIISSGLHIQVDSSRTVVVSVSLYFLG